MKIIGATPPRIRSSFAIGIIFVLACGYLASASAAIIPGTKCSKVGLKSTSGGKRYTCIKLGSKLYWDNGVKIAAKKTKPTTTPTATPTATPTTTPTATPTPSISLPPVEGPAPSQKVIAFYYAWYSTPLVDGQWLHWTNTDDIQSDYFPKLGAYSSSDTVVIAQQMAWLRQAGIGVIAISYWQGETTDDRLKKIFDLANHYGIKVTFHLEPSAQRNSNTYAPAIKQLYQKYGSLPAFFKTTETSRYMTVTAPHPIFFVWATWDSNIQGGVPVAQSYWAPGNDQIHTDINALMIACPGSSSYTSAILDGHFDGAYNYATLHLQEDGFFDWWKALPAGSLFIPSVVPGFSAQRIGYSSSTFNPRNSGAEYAAQWSAATTTKKAPTFMTITSWNEWHEGTAIEPTTNNYTSPTGRVYLDFSPQPENYYLDATKSQILNWLTKSYASFSTNQIRITVSTTSDWMDVTVTEGELVEPSYSSHSGELTNVGFTGTHFLLNQPLANALANKEVAILNELSLVGKKLTLQTASGALGKTTVVIQTKDGSSWKDFATLTWLGASDSGASKAVVLP